jgi:hypothetical protein
VHSGEEFNVLTTVSPKRGLVRKKSIRDVFEEYDFTFSRRAPRQMAKPPISGNADYSRGAWSRRSQ